MDRFTKTTLEVTDAILSFFKVAFLKFLSELLAYQFE